LSGIALGLIGLGGVFYLAGLNRRSKALGVER
jgi:hypothetical protein